MRAPQEGRGEDVSEIEGDEQRRLANVVELFGEAIKAMLPSGLTFVLHVGNGKTGVSATASNAADGPAVAQTLRRMADAIARASSAPNN